MTDYTHHRNVRVVSFQDQLLAVDSVTTAIFEAEPAVDGLG